jgi:hypothetical protein
MGHHHKGRRSRREEDKDEKEEDKDEKEEEGMSMKGFGENFKGANKNVQMVVAIATVLVLIFVLYGIYSLLWGKKTDDDDGKVGKDSGEGEKEVPAQGQGQPHGAAVQGPGLPQGPVLPTNAQPDLMGIIRTWWPVFGVISFMMLAYLCRQVWKRGNKSAQVGGYTPLPGSGTAPTAPTWWSQRPTFNMSNWRPWGKQKGAANKGENRPLMGFNLDSDGGAGQQGDFVQGDSIENYS